MSQIYFFALREDLLPVLELVESKEPLKYALAGNWLKSEVQSGIPTFQKGGDGDLESLSLPRSFFGRSEIGPVCFKNSDLSESTLCWNDFNKVDFTDCDLSGCDLRAPIFKAVKFVRTILRDADLRGSDFKDCDFTDADMRGAKLARSQKRQVRVSESQRKEIEWHLLAGDMPKGG